MSLKSVRDAASTYWTRAVASLENAAKSSGVPVEEMLGEMVESDTVLCHHLVLRAMLTNPKFGSFNESAINEIATSTWFLLRWHHAGCPTFNLSESLTSALLLTDCANLPADAWTPPFNPVVIQLPSPSVLKVADKSIIRHASCVMIGSVKGFTRNQLQMWGGSRSSDAFMNMITKHEGDARSNTIVRVIPDGFYGSGAHLFNETGVEGSWQEGTFGDWLKQQAAVNLTVVEGDDSSAPVDDDVDSTSIINAWRIAMSLWQYLDDLGSKQVGSTNRERFSRFVQGKGRTYRVGGEIKLRAPREVLASIGTAGWKVHSRFMVRGHWTHQPCGPGRASRRRQWVQPYWKGPQGPQAVLDRTYRVDP